MLEFGVLTHKEGHNGIHCVDRYHFNLENLDWVLDRYKDYRVIGDLNEAYEFLTKPDRSDEPNLWLGCTSAPSGGDEEEYFLVRVK